MIYGQLSCSRIFLLIFNHRKIAEFKGLYDEKKTYVYCVKAETETYIVQKPVPNTPADLCTLSVSICFQFLNHDYKQMVSNLLTNYFF